MGMSRKPFESVRANTCSHEATDTCKRSVVLEWLGQIFFYIVIKWITQTKKCNSQHRGPRKLQALHYTWPVDQKWRTLAPLQTFNKSLKNCEPPPNRASKRTVVEHRYFGS
jgi:hypothetical protein